MPRLNAQAAVRRLLAEELPDAEVRASVPDPRPARLVVVRREGGCRDAHLLDTAGIGIDMYAPTELEASELAEAVSDAMLRLPFSEGFAKVSEETCRSDYDVKAGCPRWYASYTLRTFKPKG